MSDSHTWNHAARRRPDPPAPALLRTLWRVVQAPSRSVTAAIFESHYGHELRVHCNKSGDNILSSTPSRRGDEFLEREAEAIRITLQELGWRPAP